MISNGVVVADQLNSTLLLKTLSQCFAIVTQNSLVAESEVTNMFSAC